MPLPQFVGFSPLRRRKIHLVHGAAMLCLERAQEAACLPGEDLDEMMTQHFALLKPDHGGWWAVRHLVLKSIASMSLLCRHTKLRVFDVVPRPRGQSQDAGKATPYNLAYRPPWSVPHRPWMLPYDPNTESLPFADVDILKTPYYTCGYEHEGYRDLGTVPRKPGVFRPTTGPARWNYLEAQMERSQRGTYLEMRLFPPFWTMDFLVNDGECQVLTYCHKLAHLAAGSEDVPVKYESCYGFGGVQRAKKAGLSAHNAENISMFALRFHPQLADLLPPRLGQQLSRS